MERCSQADIYFYFSPARTPAQLELSEKKQRKKTLRDQGALDKKRFATPPPLHVAETKLTGAHHSSRQITH